MSIAAQHFFTGNPGGYQTTFAAGVNTFEIRASGKPYMLLFCQLGTASADAVPVYDKANTTFDQATQICTVSVYTENGGDYIFIPIVGGPWPIPFTSAAPTP